jgi:hypothetical protein
MELVTEAKRHSDLLVYQRLEREEPSVALDMAGNSADSTRFPTPWYKRQREPRLWREFIGSSPCAKSMRAGIEAISSRVF